MQIINSLSDKFVEKFGYLESYFISDNFKVNSEEVSFFIDQYKPKNKLEED
jgi:hypothetical protein